MTLIFRRLICHCVRHESASFSPSLLHPDAAPGKELPMAARACTSGEHGAGRQTYFSPNQNMAGAIGSVYWYIHKYFICVQLLPPLRTLQPPPRQKGGYCTLPEPAAWVLVSSPRPKWLHMKEASAWDQPWQSVLALSSRDPEKQSIIHSGRSAKHVTGED